MPKSIFSRWSPPGIAIALLTFGGGAWASGALPSGHPARLARGSRPPAGAQRHHRLGRRGPKGRRGLRGIDGPPGATGAAGPTGRTGPPGTANIVSHSVDFSEQPNVVTHQILPCPAGQYATGGGYETEFQDPYAKSMVYAIIDAPLGNLGGGPALEGQRPIGWKVYVKNPTATVQTGRLFAVCTG